MGKACQPISGTMFTSLQTKVNHHLVTLEVTHDQHNIQSARHSWFSILELLLKIGTQMPSDVGLALIPYT